MSFQKKVKTAVCTVVFLYLAVRRSLDAKDKISKPEQYFTALLHLWVKCSFKSYRLFWRRAELSCEFKTLKVEKSDGDKSGNLESETTVVRDFEGKT